MQHFKPLNEREMADLRKILEPGTHQFEILEARYAKAQSSENWMYKLKTEVVSFGIKYIQYVNLVLTPKMMWLTKHFCESIGHPEFYENGFIPTPQIKGKRGFFVTEHELDNKGANKSVVKDFIPREKAEQESQENIDPNNIGDIPWTDDELPKEF